MSDSEHALTTDEAFDRPQEERAQEAQEENK